MVNHKPGIINQVIGPWGLGGGSDGSGLSE